MDQALSRRPAHMRTEFTKLLKSLRKNVSEGDLELVRNAYRAANRAHQGQMRLSGDPHIDHSIAVARILTSLDLDVTTVAAGLLHDALEDTSLTYSELEAGFGEEIATLVDGVTKISTLRKSSPTESPEEKQAGNLQKMLVATAKDVRVILIKLADRLHNMRTIEFVPVDKARRIARETLDIYAPLAHRLGIARWKWELEDHAFHLLEPERYKEIAALVAMKRREREARLKETIEFIEGRLAEAEVNARVIGRPKHFYSIHQKMLRQAKDFDEVMDVQAVRIITQTAADCYNALGVMHSIWTPVPGRFKDYIAMPKMNMYQSIHTTVMRENGRPLEIQIRTETMDHTAREGIASHWVYKEGDRRRDAKLDGRLKWLRQMYDWLKEAHAPEELLDSVRRDFSPNDVYVFTPKGEVKELPAGATPLDFAYMIHSDIGHHCIGVRVNGRMVPLRYNLQTGDVVEILTSKSQNPHQDWLDMVVTGKARSRIRQRLRELGDLPPLDADQTKREKVAPPRKTKSEAQVREVDDATREKLLRVEGSKGMAAQFAKCCNPMPGHAIVGYVTKGTGITIHRADCKNFASTRRDPKRTVEASWEGEAAYETGVRVAIGSRPNVLADITEAIRPLNVDITNAKYQAADNGKSYFDFVFTSPDRATAARVVAALGNVAGVGDVQSMSPHKLARLK